MDGIIPERCLTCSYLKFFHGVLGCVFYIENTNWQDIPPYEDVLSGNDLDVGDDNN